MCQWYAGKEVQSSDRDHAASASRARCGRARRFARCFSLLAVPEAITKLGPFAALGAAAWAVSCLPAGAPPAGQHIVHDRTLAGVYFVPSEVAGIPSRVLALGPLRPYPRLEGDSRRDMLSDVYYVPVPEPPSTAAALDQVPIITDFVLPKGEADTYRFVSDSWGRPVYLRCLRSSYDVAERFDWATGEVENLSPNTAVTTSSGSRLDEPG